MEVDTMLMCAKKVAAYLGATALGFGSLLAMTPTAQAQNAEGLNKSAGTFLMRGRIIGVLPDVTSTITTIGGKVQATDTFVPEVDFSYFLTDQIAFELIAATTRHGMKATGTAAGTVNLGSVWLLPPTLTVQWHPMPKASFSPYIGAGMNYTFFYNNKAPGGLINSVTYKNNAGYALQLGADIAVKGPWFMNLDVKKIFLSTNANVNRGFVSAKVDLDPVVAGIGFGYHF
jgi:outer membrane protein